MKFSRKPRIMNYKSLGIVLWAVPALFLTSAMAQSSSATQAAPAPRIEFNPTLRWGKPSTDSDSARIADSLTQVFIKESGNLNFSKRGLTNLLEQALPRQLGKLFPFRRPHALPPAFFFENFAPHAFLVGELNTRVPPILAETETAEWLELRSRESISPARELRPQFPVNQGLRSLSLQNPPMSEIFSTTWNKNLEQAVTILEYGGAACLRKAEKKGDTSNQQLPAHVRCSVPLQTLAKENAIPKQLPRKLNANVAANSQTPAPSVHPNCVPMGRLSMQSLELLGDEKAGHCLLWRASKDERFQQRAFSSKLICLNARHKSFQRTRFNSVVALLPSSRPDSFHILESEDGLLTSHKLSLSTLSVSKDEVTTNSGQNLRNAIFPQQRTGLYACQQASSPSNQPFPPTEMPSAQMEWLYVDDSIYAGLKAVRPETDVAWRIKETSENAIDVERLNWSQLQYDHPSITSDRPFICAASRHIDALCGVRILQTALQISEEWLSGELDRSGYPVQVQLSVAVLLSQALEKTMRDLPDWALRDESQTLLGFFSTKAKSLSENRVFAGAAPKIELPTKTFSEPRIYLDLPRDSQEYLAIKKSISSSVDFWALLKQKSL